MHVCIYYKYLVLHAVAASRSVAGAQASTANVDLLYRVKSSPFISHYWLAALHDSLQSKPYVSGSCEFLKRHAVIQSADTAVYQVRVNLQI